MEPIRPLRTEYFLADFTRLVTHWAVILAESSSLLSPAGACHTAAVKIVAELPSTPDKAKILRRHIQSRWHKTGAGPGI